MTLTSKQELFAQHIANGSTQADAYRAAYNTEKMADNSIHVNASKLIADAKVALRVGQLRSEIAKRNLWTREMSVKALVKAYRVAEDGGNPSAMTGAVRELNAMHGFNEPSKLDVTSSDGSMSPGIDASKLSTEALAELMAAKTNAVERG